MAFYRVENGDITKAEGDLFGPGYDLLAAEHDTYEYPAFGWYWFDTDEEAEAIRPEPDPEPEA